MFRRNDALGDLRKDALGDLRVGPRPSLAETETALGIESDLGDPPSARPPGRSSSGGAPSVPW
ncbi:hypothetical protein C5D36_09820 [Rathayibacter sp. AY1C6]|nr:hypothetical protein C5D36_09820 [Rathayibacter sp. AY1C6]PPG28156.1 hypothetical protein C5C25_12725 [Rathayibacter sp. AY2B9]